MKVVILAGGYGSRFGKATDFLPKPMIPIGPFPILRADGTPTIVKVTEDGTSATSAWVLGGVGCIGCRSPSSNVTAGDGTLLGMTFALGTDTNALTFTNTAPPAP